MASQRISATLSCGAQASHVFLSCCHLANRRSAVPFYFNDTKRLCEGLGIVKRIYWASQFKRWHSRKKDQRAWYPILSDVIHSKNNLLNCSILLWGQCKLSLLNESVATAAVIVVVAISKVLLLLKCCYCCSYCRRCYFQSVPTTAVIVVVAISKGLLQLQSVLLSLLFLKGCYCCSYCCRCYFHWTME